MQSTAAPAESEQRPLPAGAARQVPLRMSPDEFRRAGHALVDQVAEFLGSLADRPVTPGESAEAVRALLGADQPLPEQGIDAGDLLREAGELLFDHSLLNGHPRFFGYITSSPTPIGMLGDLLAAAVNPNVGAWILSPMATEIEEQTIRWIAELVGYGSPSAGLLVSGGNMANTVGLLAARVAAADWDLRQEGVGATGAAQLCIYASSETHTWLPKAADIAGLGTAAIRWIPVDSDGRLELAPLAEALVADRAAGRRAMMVVGTAGSVSTGAVDPLAGMADLCREFGAWFHVDAAYGGPAAVVPDAHAELGSLRLADSVALDPHKWLYAPLEAGCLLVRDPARLRAAFAYHPVYYRFGTEVTNYFDLGPQNSRGFRALKVWLALRQAGRAGYARMIGDEIELSRRLHQLVELEPELEPLTQSLSINTFRYVPADCDAERGRELVEGYLNALNEALVDRLQASGELFVSNAVVGGRYALRSCIVNFNTEAGDIDALPGIVVRHGREVDAELRAAGKRPGISG